MATCANPGFCRMTLSIYSIPFCYRRAMQKVRTLAAAVLLLAVVAVGCARIVWTKRALTKPTGAAIRTSASVTCGRAAYFGTGLVGAINAQEFQERCLVARGYYKVRVEPSPAPASSPASSTYQASGGGVGGQPDTSGKCSDPNCICSADGQLIKCNRVPWNR
jgi:hypothetical protein